MKRSKSYAYPARLTREVHSALTATAVKRGISINSLAGELLSQSFVTYPGLQNLPVASQPVDKPFSLRLKNDLHESLSSSSKGSSRSLNAEILGRLLLMTCPTGASLLDAWTHLNLRIATLVELLTPGDDVANELVAAKDAFERKLLLSAGLNGRSCSVDYSAA